MRGVLDKAAERLKEQDFEDTPLVEAALKFKMGLIYDSLGETNEAARFIIEAADLRREHLGVEHPDTLLALEERAGFARRNDPDAYQTRLDRYQEVLDIRRRTLGDNHPDTLRSRMKVLRAKRNIDYSKRASNPDLAPISESEELAVNEKALRKILKSQSLQLGPDHLDDMATMQELVFNLQLQGKPQEANAMRDRLYEIQLRVLGEKHPHTLNSMTSIALGDLASGHEAEGLAMLIKTRELSLKVLGEQHPLTIGLTWRLMQFMALNERWEELAPLVEWYVSYDRDLDSTGEMRLGILHAWLGDREAHEKATRRFIVKHALTQDSNDAERAAKSVMVMGDDIAPDLLGLAVSQAYKATEYINDQNRRFINWFAMAHGMADYRTGKYESARVKLKEARTNAHPLVTATAIPWQAMAEYRLGEVETARALLDQGRDKVQALQINQRNWQAWHDILVARIALREAEALIDPEGKLKQDAEPVN
jgi:tetratricopeptide (TPR) repeat protein